VVGSMRATERQVQLAIKRIFESSGNEGGTPKRFVA